MKKIIVVNDLSGLGNCSLSANMAVFSAMGWECLGIPTAVLTNQSCYSRYQPMAYTVDFSAYRAAWRQAGVSCDAVYSGYFRTAEQMVDFYVNFLEQKGARLYLNDPVMGDLGERYDNCSNTMLEQMRRLVRQSTLTTPNVTELCLLTGVSYDALTARREPEALLAAVIDAARQLCHMGAQQVVVTGVKGQGDTLYNIWVNRETAIPYAGRRLHGDFSGTGDLFSSVLFGALLNGKEMPSAIQTATDWISRAVANTVPQHTNPNDGLCYQPILKDLIGEY